MRILIDGANGRIGRMFAQKMFESRQQVILLGRNSQEILDMACQYNFDAFLFPSYQLPHSFVQKSDILINCSASSEKQRYLSLQACLIAGAHYLDLSCEPSLMKLFLSSQSKKKIIGSQSVCILGLGIGSLLSDYVAYCFETKQKKMLSLCIIWQLLSASRFPSVLDVMVRAYLLSLRPRCLFSFFKRGKKGKRSLLMTKQSKSILGILLPLGVDLLIQARSLVSSVYTYALIDHQFISRLRIFEKVSFLLPRKIIESWVSNFLSKGKTPLETFFKKAPFRILAEAQFSEGRKDSLELSIETPSQVMTAVVIDLCNKLAKEGKKPGIYSPTQYLGTDILEQIPGVHISRKVSNLVDFE